AAAPVSITSCASEPQARTSRCGLPITHRRCSSTPSLRASATTALRFPTRAASCRVHRFNALSLRQCDVSAFFAGPERPGPRRAPPFAPALLPPSTPRPFPPSPPPPPPRPPPPTPAVPSPAPTCSNSSARQLSG